MAGPKFCTQCAGPLEHLGRIVGIYTDRYGDGGEYTLNIYYEARVPKGSPSPGSDVSETKWFPLDRLPEPIAFANNREALAALKKRLDS